MYRKVIIEARASDGHLLVVEEIILVIVTIEENLEGVLVVQIQFTLPFLCVRQTQL